MSAATRLYADHNASAPLRPAARSAMIAALETSGNAASIHTEGRAARALIETARTQVAALCQLPARAVVFTSGASEAATTLLTPRLGLAKLVVFAGEHPCVRAGGRFSPQDIVVAPSTQDGVIDLAALERIVAALDAPFLLALQAANNETGAVQPVAAASALAHARGGVVLCDAAQAAGRIPVDQATAGADWLILSSHKLGGPKGAGALAGRGAGLPPEAALIVGGGQERGARAGTENVPAIVGFGAAAVAAEVDLATEAARLAALRDRFEAGLRDAAPEVEIFARNVARLPNTSCFSVAGVAAETLLMALDLAGVAASSGSACSSGKVGRSATLAAMGVTPERAAGAMRFSFGWSTTDEEVDQAIRILRGLLGKLLARRPRSAA